MSAVSTPRISLTLSSRRTSISADNGTPQPGALQRTSTTGAGRRNRTALRDYYNIKANEGISDLPTSGVSDEPVVAASVIDDPDLVPADYIKQLFATQNAENLLRHATQIEREIRILDGEKKALVYNNYAKLIAATDTIRQMREKMDPLTPTTQSLQADIERIAELATQLRDAAAQKPAESEETRIRRAQRDAARWALGAEERLRDMVKTGDVSGAEQHWEEVHHLLDEWKNVTGTDRIRDACSSVMAGIGKNER